MRKLDETILPQKEAFYSKLTNEGITDEEYQHAQTVWKEFNIESMKDYQNLYNLADVILLADIFENSTNIARIIMDWIRLGISVRQLVRGMLY